MRGAVVEMALALAVLALAVALGAAAHIRAAWYPLLQGKTSRIRQGRITVSIRAG
jgi:hypothetical protein